jgi:hypothetical protein
MMVTGAPLPVGCGWSGRSVKSYDYVTRLAECHFATLRNIGFANAEVLKRIGRAPLRRIHFTCIEREKLDWTRFGLRLTNAF